MFSKAGSLEGRKEQAVSGKDGKRMVEGLVASFGCKVREVLGVGKDGLVTAKLPESGALLLGRQANGAVPKKLLFMDVDGRGKEWVPTLETLWLVPDLIPALVVHAPVSQFVINGSDVMLPGVVRLAEESRSCFGIGNDLRVGQLRALFAHGNPMPFAVGKMTVDKQVLLGAGFRGKGMKIIHVYGDHLWQANGSGRPNEGFFADRVEPIIRNEAPKEATDAHASQLQELSLDQAIHPPNAPAEDPGEPSEDCAGKAEEEQGEDKAGSGSAVSAKDLAEKTLLQTLKRHVKDKDLPMLVSTFYSQIMLPSRPAGTVIDLRSTEYKKVSGLLGAMAACGLLSVDKDARGVESLVSIDRSHDLLKTFEPWPPGKEERAVTAEPEDVEDGIFCVSELFRAQSPQQKTIVSEGGLDPSEWHNAGAIKSALTSFIAKRGLEVKGDRRTLDLAGEAAAELVSALGGGKKGGIEGDRVDRGTAADVFLQRLIAGYRVESPSQDGQPAKAKAGKPPKVQVKTEQRQGNKWVTRCWGFETFGGDAVALAKLAQVKLASASSVQPCESHVHGSEFLVQGRLAAKVVDIVAKECRLHPSRHFQVHDGRTKPK